MKRMILALALCAAPAAAQPSAAAPAPVDYASEASWLCLPGRQDACGRPLATADLNPDGYGPVTLSAPAAAPPIDCFYVYPTVSRDPGLNSDLTAGIEEQGAAAVQFARFASVCRTYAPIYRQVTLAAIPRAIGGEDLGANFNQAYGDVRAAWHYYLDHYNEGRPFVLIGHSQGTIHATRLLAEEIENGPAARRMLSALLIGYAVEVPEGGVVGGSLHRTPLCTRAGQTGCVVAYMSFRAASPPPLGSLMGRATHPGMTAGCVNPAALAGGSAPLDAYVLAAVSQFGGPVITWSSTGPPPAPFLHVRGLISGECRHDGQAGWLAITVNADPADARTDQIPGDVYFGPQLIPGWGLHLGDVPLALGDLIRLVGTQRDAWLSAAPARRSE
ncbi:MAG TPA: DUF3089 domain-containing protein [Allosphingosinicella sp.]|nr:DUF3089 domain-containing protein [Allosphingosinicella sp.]